MKSRFGIPGLALVAAFGLAGCDNPVDPGHDHDHDHDEPETVHVIIDGEAVASAGWREGTVEGAIELVAGQSSPHVQIVFHDDHDHEFHIDDDYWLAVEVEDESIATFEVAEQGAFSGVFQGIAPGETGVRFSLMHGAHGHGHPDFVSRWVPVIVDEASTGT